MTTPAEKVYVKYKNKKIHEVGDDNSYIQMPDLFKVVLSGVKIKVIDDRTGDDVTSMVLARLIYEQLRRSRTAFKAEDLTALIRKAA
jgi:polyhydroxyalkanoate synthesis regulator protein